MPNKFRAFLIAGLFILFSISPVSAQADEVSVQALVDHATALIGDRIKFSIDITYRAGTEISAPDFKDGRIGDFEIKDSGRKLKKGFFGNSNLEIWYYVASYSVGKHQIPQVEIKYKNKSDKDWKSIKTKPLNIEIETVLPKAKLPADIKDVKGPFGYFEINWLLAGLAVGLLAIVILIILYKFRKKPAPIRLAHETALEELEAARSNFLKNSDIKEYYAGISDCVRRYIERRFKFRASEMTTEEFLGSLRESTILSLDQKDILKDFLNACDLVKFAKYSPGKGEMESVYLGAQKFIEETKEAKDVRV